MRTRSPRVLGGRQAPPSRAPDGSRLISVGVERILTRRGPDLLPLAMVNSASGLAGSKDVRGGVGLVRRLRGSPPCAPRTPPPLDLRGPSFTFGFTFAPMLSSRLP